MRLDEIESKPEIGLSGFTITKQDRRTLLSAFSPKYNLVAHHITYQFGVPINDETKLPAKPKSAEVVGYADDGSLEALVLSIDGITKRPDGGAFHLTWSKTRDRNSADSNGLLEKGWQRVKPIPVDLTPGFFQIVTRR